jgi:Na+/proline symporter
MQWDLGLRGLALLVGMSVGFGVVAHLVVRRATRWLWLIAAAGYFVGGLLISEVWFGWATQEELQPNIDGLSFDEVLLLGLIPGVVTVLVTRAVTRRRRAHRADASDSDRPGAVSGTR